MEKLFRKIEKAMKTLDALDSTVKWTYLRIGYNFDIRFRKRDAPINLGWKYRGIYYRKGDYNSLLDYSIVVFPIVPPDPYERTKSIMFKEPDTMEQTIRKLMILRSQPV